MWAISSPAHPHAALITRPFAIILGMFYCTLRGHICTRALTSLANFSIGRSWVHSSDVTWVFFKNKTDCLSLVRLPFPGYNLVFVYVCLAVCPFCRKLHYARFPTMVVVSC